MPANLKEYMLGLSVEIAPEIIAKVVSVVTYLDDSYQYTLMWWHNGEVRTQSFFPSEVEGARICHAK